MSRKSIPLDKATMHSFILCPFILISLNQRERETDKTQINLATFSYVGVASEKPPIITVAIRPTRYSHGLILSSKEFSLNLPTKEFLEAMDCFGFLSGRKRNKLSAFDIELESGQKIEAPSIKEAPLILECALISTILLSQRGASHDLFIAEVIGAFCEESFSIETHPGIVTTNFAYRELGQKLGRAFKVWRKRKGG